MVDHLLHHEGGAAHSADGDALSSLIGHAYGSHHFDPLHHHSVAPYLRVEDGHIGAVAGHIQSDPHHAPFELANLTGMHHPGAIHSQSFANVMSHSDPLLHHTEYHMPPLRLSP